MIIMYSDHISGKDMGRNLCVPCLAPRVRKTCFIYDE